MVLSSRQLELRMGALVALGVCWLSLGLWLTRPKASEQAGSLRRSADYTSEATSTASAGGAEVEQKAVLVATRVHQKNASRPVDLAKLEAFIERALGWGSDFSVAIAVGADGEVGVALLGRVQELVAVLLAQPKWSGRVVKVVAVTPWGMFVPGLNALVQLSLDLGCDHLLFSSVETDVSIEGVSALQQRMTTDTLVVGAAFGDHAFQRGVRSKVGASARVDAGTTEYYLAGDTCPWNTLALWHAPTLALVGFLGVSEGLDVANNRADGGVEEMAAIAVLQLVHPRRSRAELCKVPGLAWDVASFSSDPARQEWHARKMASKVSRPAAQLAQLPGVPPGLVYHADLSGTES